MIAAFEWKFGETFWVDEGWVGVASREWWLEDNGDRKKGLGRITGSGRLGLIGKKRACRAGHEERPEAQVWFVEEQSKVLARCDTDRRTVGCTLVCR